MFSHALDREDSALLHICSQTRSFTKELQNIQSETDVIDRRLEEDDHIICIKGNAVLQIFWTEAAVVLLQQPSAPNNKAHP